jgi:hypothetical protein
MAGGHHGRALLQEDRTLEAQQDIERTVERQRDFASGFRCVDLVAFFIRMSLVRRSECPRGIRQWRMGP